MIYKILIVKFINKYPKMKEKSLSLKINRFYSSK